MGSSLGVQVDMFLADKGNLLINEPDVDEYDDEVQECSIQYTNLNTFLADGTISQEIYDVLMGWSEGKLVDMIRRNQRGCYI